MKRWSWLVAALVVGTGCDEGKKVERPVRAQLRRTGPAMVEVIPTEGQLPYCMLYTVSEKGLIRQLILTRENRSIRCDANRPIANTSFRIPAQEGKVKLYVFFSNDRIDAGPVAQQLHDLRHQERISAMDMRLPGRVFLETLEFTPEETVTGAVVTEGGQLVDGGTAAMGDSIGAAVLPDGGIEGGPGASEMAP